MHWSANEMKRWLINIHLCLNDLLRCSVDLMRSAHTNHLYFRLATNKLNLGINHWKRVRVYLKKKSKRMQLFEFQYIRRSTNPRFRNVSLLHRMIVVHNYCITNIAVWWTWTRLSKSLWAFQDLYFFIHFNFY